jgi:copper transport protein
VRARARQLVTTRHKALARSIVAAAVAIAAALSLSTTAWAHAQLLGASPASGSTAPAQPKAVTFEFNQAVGGTAGAVRVYDAQGNEVDDLDVSHPHGNEHWMGVGLKPSLPDGTYTATYRVISADTHIVYGGLVFNLGHPGAAPKFTVAGLIGRNESGHVTKVAFGVVRALNYLTLALMIGGMAFLLLVWRGGLAAVADAEQRWSTAAQAFASRLAQLLAVSVVLGVIVSVLGVLLQGASAAGVSLWSSLKCSIVESTLESRFGWVWGVRAIVWALLGALLLLTHAVARSALIVEARSDGASGDGRAAVGQERAGPRGLSPAIVVPLALGAAYLAITPALAGHASIESPTGVFFPSDAIHVLAASVWVGGIACLLIALPKATRRLESGQRSRLLLAMLARFSSLALGCVVAIAATGAIQAYIDVRSLHGLLHTTYGALVLVKTALLLTLIGLGWVNRRRVIPTLRRLAGELASPGGVGVLARRTMRGELALMLCVLGVTAALIGYAPPIDTASGPFSTNTTLGPAELELTVEPAKVGPNTIHLYLIDAKTGVQFTATRELTASARLPAKGIGPLPLHARLAGPGHYVLESAALSPSGAWDIEIVDRVSEFEQHTQTVKVPIE